MKGRMDGRKIKVLLLVPLPLVLFCCLIFYALGGGRESYVAVAGKAGEGFNRTLPKPTINPKDSTIDKMTFYDRADRDSVRVRDNLRRDPYHGHTGDSVGGLEGNLSGQLRGLNGRRDTLGDRILERLENVKRSIRNVTPEQSGLLLEKSRSSGSVSGVGSEPAGGAGWNRESGPDYVRLQETVKRLQSVDTAHGDQQLDKWNGILDKIVSIQHPRLPVEREKIVEDAPAYPVLVEAGDAGAVLDRGLAGAQFYEIGDNRDSAAAVETLLISCVVDEDQVLVSGGTIGLRLVQRVVIGGVVVPRGTPVYGSVSLAGERLQVSVASIRVGNAVLPVALTGFDADGLAGIRIPGALERDVSKETAGEAIGTIGSAGSLDPSLGAQAANAGIQAARTFFRRKVTLVKVGVKAGYLVFLKNTKR